MGFWTFCCKTPQFHRSFYEWGQPIGDTTKAGRFRVDAEGDWKVLSNGAGILSDGSLWCWDFEVARYHAFRYGLDYYDSFTGFGGTNERLAVRIGDDDDWAFVTWGLVEGRGYAIKEDGSLWAFGFNSAGNSNSLLGIGLVNKSIDLFYGSNYGWEVRLSSSIATARDYGANGGISSHRPLRLYLKKTNWDHDAAESNDYTVRAEFDFDWLGFVRSQDFTLTSGGSGYLSPPTASLVGVGADAGKTVQGTVTAMSPATASVTGFTVVSGGGGYTHATAFDKHSMATARGVIQNGAVVAWQMADAGARQYSRLAPEESDVVVCGDGTGASAAIVKSTAAVQTITFPETPTWTEKPTIQFSGGGGAGAAASVTRIVGRVSNIRITNPGAGYPQVMHVWAQRNGQETIQDRDWAVGSTTLTPSRVTSVVKTNADAAYSQLNRQSNGVVPAFSTSQPPDDGTTLTTTTSVQLVAHGKQPVSLTVSPNNSSVYELTAPLSGYAHPPLLRVSRNIKRNGGALAGGWSLRDREFDPPGSQNSNPPPAGAQSRGLVYLQLRRAGNDSWPCSASQITVSAPVSSSYQGSSLSSQTISATFVNIDGMMLLDSQSMSTATSPWFGTTPDGMLVPISESFYTGVSIGTASNNSAPNTSSATTHVYHFNGFSDWSPPTSDEKVRIYFSAPTHGGGDPPYIEVAPDANGKPGVATIVNEGGYYTTTPNFITTTHFFPDPVRVGTDTWKSVSISGTRSYGITTDGQLYWWGYDTANTQRDCPFPAPVGRGVAFDIEGGDRVGGRHSATRDMSHRFYCGPPEHGDRFAQPSLTVSSNTQYGGQQAISSFGTGSGAYYQYPNIENKKGNLFNGYGARNQTPKTQKAALEAQNEYFVDSAKERYWNEAILGNAMPGKGYLSVPQSSFIQQGPTAEFTISARLIGPSTFTHLVGDYARASDGTWYFIPTPDSGFIVPGPIPEHSYSVSIEPQSFEGFPGTYLVAGDVSVTRTKTHSLRSYLWRASDAGGGYGTVSIIASIQNPATRVLSSASPSITETSPNGVGGFGGAVELSDGSQSGVLDLSPVTSTVDISNEFFVDCGELIPAGLFNSQIQSFTQPTITISATGGGEGAVVDTITFESGFESHLMPVTAPGTTENFGGYFGISQSGDVVSSGNLTSTVRPLLTNLAIEQIAGTAMREDDKIYYVGSLLNVQRRWPFEVDITNNGRGYREHARAEITQQSGVAEFEPVFDGKIACIAVASQGLGYSSPPQLTLTAGEGGGTVGTATAVIAGPVSAVTITSPGSGYRIPPKVVFSGTGISPSATCTLNASGGVESVTIKDGGRYRNTPPTVSFTPVNQVESLTLDSGGSGYKQAPKVHIGSGGGVGASATATICGEVDEIIVKDGGSGYVNPPFVQITGGGGTGAKATATLTEDGRVDSITVDDGGECYRSAPTVSFGQAGGAMAVAEICAAVSEVVVTDGGQNYTSPPTVVFEGGGGAGASATSQISGGAVVGITVSGGGGCYTIAPLVRFEGGGGSGAKAVAEVCGPVSSVTVTSGGASYSVPPEVVFEGGQGSGASATAVINGSGVVTGITVDDGGQCYRTAPLVSLIADTSGSGAEAEAVLDGYVDQVTLVSRGEGFVNPPTVTFHDGGGSGAAATAVLGAPGSGAVGSVVFDGSVIFCTATGSSGLQTEPSITIADSTNHRIAALQTRLNAGQITQAEFDDQVKAFRADLRVAIRGKVTAINVPEGKGGSLYRATGSQNVPLCTRKRLARPRVVSDHCLVSNNVYTTDSYFSDPLSFTVDANGAVASVSASSIQNNEYLKKPKVLPEDAVSLRAYTCLTATAAGIANANVVSAANVTINSPANARGVRSAAVSGRRYGGSNLFGEGLGVSPPNTVAVKGEVVNFNGRIDSARPTTPTAVLYYSTLPQVQIQDELGTGATCTLRTFQNPVGSSFVIVSGGTSQAPPNIFALSVTAAGSNYTLAARPVITGGTPKAWSSPISATATVANGRVQSISVSNNNDGYSETPDVLLVGGGGVGAEAKAYTDIYGRLMSIAVTCQGEGYDSAPTVVVVDRERPFEDSPAGKALQDYINTSFVPFLRNYTVEFALHEPKWQGTTSSPVGYFSSVHGAEFIPFFLDSGHVEHVDQVFAPDFETATQREISQTPTVTFSGQAQTAAAAVLVPISFTNVMSNSEHKSTEAYWLP